MNEVQGREPRIGVGAAILRDDHILLMRRLRAPDAGTFSIPGGKIDWMEPIEDAIRRETLEETGLALGALTLLCVTDQLYEAPPEHWVAPIYLAEDFTGEATLLEPEKHADLAWYPLADPPAPLSIAARVAIARLRGF